jgi:hypothetical protein
MDQIFAGENHFDRSFSGIAMNGANTVPMNFVPNIILHPARNQIVSGPPLLLSEVPDNLLRAVEINLHANHATMVEQRWIMIREKQRGMSRWYVSEAFERDICSYQRINEAWKANEGEVKEMWLSGEGKGKYAQGLIQQFSLHSTPGMPPTPTRIPRSKINLTNGEEVDVDCAVCLAIVNIDEGFFYMEYFPPPSPTPVQPAVATSSRNNAFIQKVGDDVAFLDTIEEFEWTGELDELLKTLTGGFV